MQPAREPTYTSGSWLPGWTQVVLPTRSGAGSRRGHLPPTITTFCHWLQEYGPEKGGLFSEVLSFLRSRTLCQVGPRVIRRALLVGARTEHLTRPVHTAPPAPLLCQAGLVAPGSVDKGMACPPGCQNSMRKAPPQMGVVRGPGVESDTTTLAGNSGM